MAYDPVPLSDEFYRKLGEGRKEVLHILSEADEPKRLGIVFRDADLNMDSRTHHFEWLTGKKSDTQWWPDGVGPLIEVDSYSDDSKNERKLVLAEGGERVVATLRDVGDIITDEDFKNIKVAQKSLSGRVEKLERNDTSRGESLSTLTGTVEGLSDRVDEVEDRLDDNSLSEEEVLLERDFEERAEKIDNYLKKIDRRMNRLEEAVE